MWKIGLSLIASYLGYEQVKKLITKNDLDDPLSQFADKGWQQYPINYPDYHWSQKLTYHLSQFTWQMAIFAIIIYYTIIYFIGKKIK